MLLQLGWPAPLSVGSGEQTCATPVDPVTWVTTVVLILVGCFTLAFLVVYFGHEGDDEK